MANTTVYCIVPSLMTSLGFAVTFDGEYHAIDSDGYNLAGFDTEAEAIEYLSETYEDLLTAEALPCFP